MKLPAVLSVLLLPGATRSAADEATVFGRAARQRSSPVRAEEAAGLSGFQTSILSKLSSADKAAGAATLGASKSDKNALSPGKSSTSEPPDNGPEDTVTSYVLADIVSPKSSEETSKAIFRPRRLDLPGDTNVYHQTPHSSYGCPTLPKPDVPPSSSVPSDPGAVSVAIVHGTRSRGRSSSR